MLQGFVHLPCDSPCLQIKSLIDDETDTWEAKKKSNKIISRNCLQRRRAQAKWGLKLFQLALLCADLKPKAQWKPVLYLDVSIFAHSCYNH